MRRGREFWRSVMGEVDRGDRIADVARRHRVQPRTLAWWRWKLGAEERRDPLLLPVVVGDRAPEPEPVVVELRIGDVIIRVGSGSDVAYIAALVAALRS